MKRQKRVELRIQRGRKIAAWWELYTKKKKKKERENSFQDWKIVFQVKQKNKHNGGDKHITYGQSSLPCQCDY